MKASFAPLLAAFLLTACGRKEEPVPLPIDAASPSASLSLRDASLRGSPAAPTPVDGGMATVPSRAPDMGLDVTDPARDYVERYLRVTGRYGANSACVHAAASVFKDGKTTVEARNDASGACGAANQVRDVLIVDVPADRLSLAETKGHDALKKWPDGSDPEAPAAPIKSIDDPRAWTSPLRDAMKKLQLTPLRAQFYGRGTYLIVTLAGWHAPLLRDASADTLQSAAQALCPANGGAPFGVFAGVDRVDLLRFDCPDKTRWEKLSL